MSFSVRHAVADDLPAMTLTSQLPPIAAMSLPWGASLGYRQTGRRVVDGFDRVLRAIHVYAIPF